MKLRLYTLILSLFFVSMSALAQSDTVWHSSMYLEAGGPGSIASINLEHYSIEKANFNIGARFGLGTSGLRDYQNEMNADFFIPVGIFANYKLIKHKRNPLFLVGGGGIIYASTVHAGPDYLPIREKRLNGYLQLGTTYVMSNKWLLRVSYTPIISNGIGFNHWASLAIGFTF